MVELPFPIVTAHSIWQVLERAGVKRWPRIEQDPIPLNDYMCRDLSEAQRSELRFAPKSEVILFQDPRGKPYASFRTKGKCGTSVFVLLPGDFVVIGAEFKGGLNAISLLPPGGQLELGDDIATRGKMEFEAETGIKLERVISLVPAGAGPNFRQMDLLDYPCLGIPKIPLTIIPLQQEGTEFVTTVLIPLVEWLKLIENAHSESVELNSIAVTYLALRKLGRLFLL